MVRQQALQDKSLAETMSKGLLLPDDVVSKIVFENLDASNRTVILDG